MGKELVLATVRENPKLPHEISIPLGRLIRFCCNHKSTSHEDLERWAREVESERRAAGLRLGSEPR